MKKILLTLAAVFVGISAAFADADITIADAKGFTDGSVTSGWKAGDFTFTTAKNDGQTAPTFNAKGKDYRVYAKGTLAISATNDMTKIEFTISTAGLKRLAEITPSTGTVAEQSVVASDAKEGDVLVTWTGSAKEVTFTVGEKSVYGTDGAAKAGQFDFVKLVITGGGKYEAGGDTPEQPSEAGTEANPINVAKAIELSSALDASGAIENAYVTGVIKKIDEVNTSFGNATFFISDKGADNEFKIFRAKWLENANFTAEDQIAVGATVVITGKLVNWQGNEVEMSNCHIVKYDGEGGDTPKPSEGKTFKTVAEYLAAAYTDGTSTLDCPLTCTYQNGRYLYLTDGTTPMLVYGDLKTDTNADGVVDSNDEFIKYTNGDVLPAGITGKYTVFNNLRQLGSPVASTFGTATKGEPVAPKAMKANEITAELMNTYIVMNGVTIEGADRNFTVTDATGSVALFNQFNDPTYYDAVTVETGTDLTLEAIITVYKENVQLYPVKVISGGSAVENIVVDENAPVEYFNLQGIRVANPENGIFIRRQGAKATKVVF